MMSNEQFRTVQERTARTVNGFPMLFLALALGGIAIWRFIHAIVHEEIGTLILAICLFIVGLLILIGLFPVQPNESRVLIFFGRYIGSCRTEGFRWGNPFAVAAREVRLVQ